MKNSGFTDFVFKGTYYYANMVAKGIDSGIFDIVAHPDLFMQFRNSMIDEESKNYLIKTAYLPAI